MGPGTGGHRTLRGASAGATHTHGARLPGSQSSPCGFGDVGYPKPAEGGEAEADWLAAALSESLSKSGIYDVAEAREGPVPGSLPHVVPVLPRCRLHEGAGITLARIEVCVCVCVCVCHAGTH